MQLFIALVTTGVLASAVLLYQFWSRSLTAVDEATDADAPSRDEHLKAA